MQDPEQYIPESLRPPKQLPARPSRSVPLALPGSSASLGGINPVSIQTLGLFSIGIAALILYLALFAYDVGIDGTVNLGKLNDRLCWVIVGTGAGLGGLLLLLLSRLELIAQNSGR